MIVVEDRADVYHIRGVRNEGAIVDVEATTYIGPISLSVTDAGASLTVTGAGATLTVGDAGATLTVGG